MTMSLPSLDWNKQPRDDPWVFHQQSIDPEVFPRRPNRLLDKPQLTLGFLRTCRCVVFWFSAQKMPHYFLTVSLQPRAPFPWYEVSPNKMGRSLVRWTLWTGPILIVPIHKWVMESKMPYKNVCFWFSDSANSSNNSDLLILRGVPRQYFISISSVFHSETMQQSGHQYRLTWDISGRRVNRFC